VTSQSQAVALRTAWHGRLVFAVGAALTATTGVGLWGWPEAFGVDFAWEIKAQLTAAYMGAWYLVAAAALILGLRERAWSTGRIALVVAFLLTATSLVATIRFFDEFRVGDGSSLQQAIAWVWLVVYASLPPAVAIVFAVHERAGGGREYGRSRPLTGFTRIVLAVLALGCAAMGLWLTVAPDALIEVWPWTINDLSASIVGTWLVTVAGGCAWALRDGDWQRSRIVLLPSLAAPLLLLIAAVRLDGEFTGSDLSVTVYVAAVAAVFASLLAVGIAQERGTG
jgi:hypothetical protein